ncbi:hypothetical protein [Sulfitobacter profundi]|uniref:Uncharacterized protein n=1 Tax=Sulfitobacter profundi TaxID=2679961 RepID=A0ABW1YXM0_9RHOB
MKVTGDKKLMRQLKALPESARGHLATAMRRNVEEGEKIANVLAPDVTHETRGNIYSELKDDGLTGIVYAIPSDAPQEDKDRAYSIEHGRKRAAAAPPRGTSICGKPGNTCKRNFVAECGGR